MIAGVTFLTLGGAYLLFAGSTSLDECGAAAATASIGTAWLLLTRRTTERPVSLRAPWHRVLGKPLLQLAPDAARVGWVLARAVAGGRPSGAVSWQRLRHGGEDARDAGRRALVTLAVSLAPNGYVLDAPGEADALLLHRLAAAPAVADPEWPL